MKKIFLSGMMATLLMTSCNTNAPETAQATNDVVTDSLQITDPELWAAMNHKLELKADRGVMENPVDLSKFI